MKQALYRLDGQKDDGLLTGFWTSKGDCHGGAIYRGNFKKTAIFSYLLRYRRGSVPKNEKLREEVGRDRGSSQRKSR